MRGALTTPEWEEFRSVYCCTKSAPHRDVGQRIERDQTMSKIIETRNNTREERAARDGTRLREDKKQTKVAEDQFLQKLAAVNPRIQKGSLTHSIVPRISTAETRIATTPSTSSSKLVRTTRTLSC